MNPRTLNIMLGALVSFGIVVAVCFLVIIVKDKTDSILVNNTITTTSYVISEKTTSNTLAPNQSSQNTMSSTHISDTADETTALEFDLTGSDIIETAPRPLDTAAQPPIVSGDVSQEIDSLPNLTIKDIPNSTLINMEAVLQLPELPSGCEITALTTVLRHYGYNITKEYMADNFLIKAEMGQSDFNNAFISNPRLKSSYGCYPPVIKYAADAYLLTQESDLNAYNITGTDFDTVLTLVANKIPVIMWVSMDLIAFGAEYTAFSYNGNSVKWIPNEHVMVFTGYNEEADTVYVCDPLKGKQAYSMSLFRLRYEQLGEKSIIIY